jgi:hypothetical protein
MDHLEIVTGPVVTQTGTTVSGSPIVTGLTTSALRGAVAVAGSGIPDGAYVLSIDSATQVTLTQNATASASVPIDFSLEPITLTEAKAHLRVDINNDDDLIASLITAARLVAEVRLRMTLLQTTYDAYFDQFPASSNGYFNRVIRQMGPNPSWLPNGSGIIDLPKRPLVSVASVKYYDSTGTLTTYPTQNYFVSTGLGSRVQPLVGQVWPVVRPQVDGVVIRFTAGYATASQIPANIKAACKLMLGTWYEIREEVSDSAIYPVPQTVDLLLAASDPGVYS